MPFTARSGGHSYAGYSTNQGLVCDVRRLNGIHIAADGRSVTAGAGVLAIDLITALAARGLAVPTGSCPTVGVAGLALGGGVGFAARTMGATCDNILALRIVTADGVAVSADAATNPDLYWACRGGGGGNFGVVTAFTLHDPPGRHGGLRVLRLPLVAGRRGGGGMAGPGAARARPPVPDLRARNRLIGSPRCASSASFWAAPSRRCERSMAPITAVAGASLSTGAGSYLDVQRIWAGCATETAAACRTIRPASFAARSEYVATPLSSAGAEAIVTAVERRQAEGAGSGAVLLDPYGGALNRVAPDATAFVHRDQLFSAQLLAYWGSAGGGQAADAWLAALKASMRPHVSGQAYQNYIDPNLADWQHAYYATNLPRLREIKRRYDPDGLFRFRQSIPPAAA